MTAQTVFFCVCSFAHLLCVHMVSEQNFVFPFFFHPSRAYYYSPSFHQDTSPNPHFFQFAFVTSSWQSKNTMDAIFSIHKYTTNANVINIYTQFFFSNLKYTTESQHFSLLALGSFTIKIKFFFFEGFFLGICLGFNFKTYS